MTFRQLLGIVEIRTKVVSLSSFGCALLYALWRERSLALGPLGLCLAAVLLVDLGTTAFNSFFDYWHGVDEPGSNREEDKVILHEGVPALAALYVGLGCFFLASLLGLLLSVLSGAWILLFGAAGLAVGFLYNGGPFPISRSPLGELFSGGFLGSLLFLIVYRVATGSFTGSALLASLPSFLMVASILATNNACDRVGDRAAGRRTLAILLGKRAALPVYLLGSGGICLGALLAALGIYPWTVGFGMALAAAFAVPEFLKMGQRGFSHETKGPSMGGILRIFRVWTLSLGAGLLLGLLF